MLMNYDELEKVMIENGDVEHMTLQYENPGAIAGKFVGTMSITNPFYCNKNADSSNFISLISLAKAGFRDVSIWAKGVCVAHVKTWFDEA